MLSFTIYHSLINPLIRLKLVYSCKIKVVFLSISIKVISSQNPWKLEYVRYFQNITRSIFKKDNCRRLQSCGSLNDSFQFSNFLLAPFVVVVLY